MSPFDNDHRDPPRDAADDHHDAAADWAALGEDWREQQVAGVDLDALRDEVSRSRRRLRRAMLMELGWTVIAIALCAWSFLHPTKAAIPTPLSAGLIVFVVAFQGWSLWIRCRQVSDSGLTASAQVELEIARADTWTRYRRVSAWLSTVMLLGVVAMAWWDLATPEADARQQMVELHRHAGALTSAVIMVVGYAGWACWRAYRNRARLQRLHRLRAELADE
ncbi:hypothetical protein [Montanilutibacter psychrotolerans]|uniref:Transmembrane protein n=1 Tax=Montanilutibacter psychrotolerans TaxID=1327343 RepID=A0A3M8SUD2_9GAMM|nr:hypothetical protein [Lysobacter psychrotolerans]RNF82844.1 hypothetical protein EER27_13115 [Lysobacter psychrotolerans]